MMLMTRTKWRVVDLERIRFEEPRVSWNSVSFAKNDDVPGDDFHGVDVPLDAFPDHAGSP